MHASRDGGGMLRTLLLTAVLIFLGLALLYAYRAQTPSVQTVSYSQAIKEISSSQVRKVTITANMATLELQNGENQETIVPQPPAAFEKILSDYNAANPTRAVVVEFQPDSSGVQVILSILLSLVPLLLLGALFVYLSSRVRRR